MEQTTTTSLGARGQRVLVVDGYRDYADSLVEMLKLEGVEATACYGTAAALNVMLQFNPQVVLVDPVTDRGRQLNGLGFAQLLRQRNQAAELLLVAVTDAKYLVDLADHLQVDWHVLRDAFNVHLRKPVSTEDLMGLLSPRHF